ncbi:MULTISPECIES: RBBP9/YdeN family alpha/beta hydrolase [unclassified Sphingomonas]|uniref:RBBP9/YdeN family alpha/beta hydrolase n=1 Tax=unclassified Sphingomonas TaxID=196159 RepID=UPI002150A16C|nr:MULTISPECIES: alpha/beta hydrolase [unclassified Sphingomonas]MCR5870151.1 alpha/beta hydrolase [Sphingomonas sp. J344]UUX98159.1 alpha/beta hydrolase [Sphingomonas sp. J315]
MSALNNVTVLFVPGLRDHVEDHWQTHAARALPGSRTVPPMETNGLCRALRVAALDRAIAAIDGDIILAAHSAGCLMVAHWAATAAARRIRAALLVTPADVEHPLPWGYPEQDKLAANGWLPIPRVPLPFPALVVASRNDPLAAFDRVAAFAQSWQVPLYDAGEVGHLNPAAGYGPWPVALELLEGLAEESAVA